MKVAIITSIFYPEDSKTKYDLVVKVLKTIPDYAGVDYDLFIMNDGTEDPRIHEFIQEYKPSGYCKNIRYTSRENKGITKSLNELLSQVDESYNYVCLLDLDILVPVHWLKKCISVLNNFSQVGVCGILVEDYLNFNTSLGMWETKDNVLFCNVSSIGGACLVFRSEELKAYRWDETLVSDHIDAYILTRYMTDRKGICAIFDRGFHPKDEYESEEFIKMKQERFERELPVFYDTIDKLKK
jgi:cellulose synthase/poly-beta-1,6-N-acetylglucosamine synthase-like glycosyltransferase